MAAARVGCLVTSDGPGTARRAVVAVTARPYDEALSSLREQVENIAPWIAVWEARTEPDPFARRCASDAVDVIDAMLREPGAIFQIVTICK